MQANFALRQTYDKEYFNDTNEKIERALDYLTDFDSPVDLVNDQKAYELIYFLNQVSEIRELFDYIEWSIYGDKDSPRIFGEVIYHLFDINKDLDFSPDDKLKLDKPTVYNTRKCNIFFYLVKLINSVLSKSVLFALKFNRTIGLDAFILILKDAELIKNLNNSESRDFLIYLVANISILSRYSEESIRKWRDLDTIKTLLNISKTEPRLKRTILQAVTNLANDYELETIAEIHSNIRIFKKILDKGVTDFGANNFYRKKKEFLEQDNKVKIYDVHIIQVEYGLMTITAVLLAFYRLALNDKTRTDIYFNYKILTPLKMILLKGSYIEIKYTLKLIAQVSFNEAIRNDLINDTELIEAISKISIENTKKNEITISKICDQIEWNLSEKFLKAKENSADATNKHIMLSYSLVNRQECLKIKERLESFGFKVWMDLSENPASILDTTSKAIEDSYCVLMCITEKYRQSINCQAEAQYAFKLNKKIIPLILQPGYEYVQGWIGNIIKEKIYINFPKHEWKNCIRMLKIRANSIYNTVCIPKFKAELLGHKIYNCKTDMVAFKLHNESEIVKRVSYWSTYNIESWFRSNKLDMEMLENFYPLNGEILAQLYEIRSMAPHFFYKSFKKSKTDNMKEISTFSFCLFKLFSARDYVSYEPSSAQI